MNKDPEKMKINDALDLFEENGAPIRFVKGRCNIDEQYGTIVRKKRLYNPTTEEEKRLAAQLGKASELIWERVRDKSEREKLIELLKLREQYKPQNGRPQEPIKIEYTRKGGENGAGNEVQILEIPNDSQCINVPLKIGGRLKFSLPLVHEEIQKAYRAKTGRPFNVKRYLVIEMTPDKKKMFINIVYGNLDLEQMKTNPKFLNLYMTTVLARKRIDEVCRNYFCVLDDLVSDRARNVSTVRDQLGTMAVAGTLLQAATEIKTTRPKTFMDAFFGKPQDTQEINHLRIFKTGVVMVGGKECSIYSYGTKDETVDISSGLMFESGSFIVSGFDEERFKTDAKYRENVILNVFTPSRLKNSRRKDIVYPYIGEVGKNGEFENNFEIYEEFQKMERSTQR